MGEHENLDTERASNPNQYTLEDEAAAVESEQKADKVARGDITVDHIDVHMARALITRGNSNIDLLPAREIKDINDEWSEHPDVKQSYAYLELMDVKNIDGEAMEELAKFKGTIFLNSLEVLNDRGAEALSKFQGPLFMRGLRSISKEAAKSLSRREFHTFTNSDIENQIIRARINLV